MSIMSVQNAAIRLVFCDGSTMAACEATYLVQVRRARIQVAAWFNASLLARRLPTCLECRPPSAPFIWCLVWSSHWDGFCDRAGSKLWNSCLPIAAVRHGNLPVWVCWKLSCLLETAAYVFTALCMMFKMFLHNTHAQLFQFVYI